MPELPEVQTIVSDLQQKIIGFYIVDFWSDWEKAIKNSFFEDFLKNIKGKKILKIRRIGKNIFIDLNENWTLYIHLKMTGHLLVKDKNNLEKNQEFFNEKVNNYIHHIWFLDKNLKKDKNNCQIRLEFSDLRKFGKIVLLKTDEIENLPEIKKLGIDALDEKFTFEKFQEILKGREKSLIGLILLDQNLIAGIGNIYRSEILFEAEIMPKRLIGSLNNLEKRRIFVKIKEILQKAVKMRGTSDSDYRDTNGEKGHFHEILNVYHLDKTICKKCKKTEIKKEKLGQRSVFFCPICQK